MKNTIHFIITKASIFFILVHSIYGYAQPLNNPYDDMYGTSGSHWTDSISWSTIFSVEDYGAIANDTIDDLNSVESAIDAAYLAGGGVVYFPQGKYKFSNTLKLKSGIILRGAEFVNNIAKNDDFQPLSILEFPKYNPVFSDSGSANLNAFKSITGYTKSINNIGIVDLDINRARIEFHPSFTLIGMNGGQGTDANYQPVEQNRNCIIMGVRSNNAAIPDPSVPAIGQNLWQRFSWRFAANIDLFFAENVIVANCKLNDLSYKRMDDSFDQPGYITTTSVVVTPDSLTRFNYATHYGISVNRAKIMGTLEDKTLSIQPFIWYPDPEQEPSLFARGVEILDNWVYKELRIAITASGLGLLIKGNISKDKTNKIAFLTPNGQKKNTNYSATYENRGIDFSGWDVRVEDNDVEAFDLGWPGTSYRSIDGEGIMNQGNSGGSNVNGLVIINNKVNSKSSNATNPAYSCYSMEEVFNVICKHNTILGPNGYYLFSATKGAKLLNNVVIDSNYVGTMNISGISGGSGNFVRYNTRLGSNYGQVNTGIINSTCNVSVSDNIMLTSNTCTDNPPSLPKALIVNPYTDTTIFMNYFIVSVSTGNIVADSIVFYNGAYRYSTVIPTDSIVQQLIMLKANINYLSAKVYKSGLFNYTAIRRISYSDVVLSDKSTKEFLKLAVFPNPTDSYIQIISNDMPVKISIFDISGVLVGEYKDTRSIDFSKYEAGVFILNVRFNDNSSSNLKIIKK